MDVRSPRKALRWLRRTFPARATGVMRRLALRAGVIRYRTEPWSSEEWRRGYDSGHLDYFAGLDELPRYSLLLGYILFLGGDPEILDVGCGQGLLRARLDGLSFRRYVGIDPTEPAIERARGLEDERTRFVLGDVRDRSLSLGSFDIVVCNEVLSVSTDPVAVLDRVHELLRPGGCLLTCVWHHAGDEQLWRLVDRRFDPVDRVEASNPANPIAVRGWRVSCHRRPNN